MKLLDSVISLTSNLLLLCLPLNNIPCFLHKLLRSDFGAFCAVTKVQPLQVVVIMPLEFDVR